MRPTPRGWAVLSAVVAAYASASAFGPRGLNAIVAPGVVALAAAAVQVYRADPPTVERRLPPRGEVGSTVAVHLDLRTETPRSASVRERLDDGLAATGADRTLSLADSTLAYELHLERRGEHRVGPTTVVLRDVLGLLRRTHVVGGRDTVVVHPRVRPLSGPERVALAGLAPGDAGARSAVEGLRRYQRGDPLRDVHWKSSARQPDDELVVRTFAPEEGATTVEVAAEAAPGRADAMAEAAASAAATLEAAGASVGLTTPSGRVAPDDPAGRRARLDHLASATEGTLSPRIRGRADVLVSATVEGVTLAIDGREYALEGFDAVDGVDGPAADHGPEVVP